ncbi:MAG: Uma2 family endonuclease [Oscillospiraceae bacterium]|nr:Uma2 family endonuclease [Oscillospiraceae bacterium]
MMYDKKDDDLEVQEAQPDYSRLYTIEEYYEIGEDVRVELYEGYLVVMQSPTLRHQGILGVIHANLFMFLKGKKCKVFTAPGVHLFKKEATVFIPDIIVVCDKSKLDIRNVDGAPDLVIEILSPSTTRMDRKLKFDKYQKAGVKEYWIIDPERNLLEVNLLVDGKYITTIYNETAQAPVSTLDGFEIDLAEVFAE